MARCAVNNDLWRLMSSVAPQFNLPRNDCQALLVPPDPTCS
jgi:hypothetical protein